MGATGTGLIGVQLIVAHDLILRVVLCPGFGCFLPAAGMCPGLRAARAWLSAAVPCGPCSQWHSVPSCRRLDRN